MQGFPPKVWFGSRDEATVAERRVKLEAWLRAVVSAAGKYDVAAADRAGPGAALLDAFLQVDEQRLGLGPPPSRPLGAPPVVPSEFAPLLEGAPPQIAAAAKAAQDLAVGRGSVNDFISELAALRALVESQSVEIDQMRRSLSQPNSPARIPPPARESPAASSPSADIPPNAPADAMPSVAQATAQGGTKTHDIDETRTRGHIATHAEALGAAAQQPALKQHLAEHQGKLTARRPRIGILGSTRGTNTLHIYEEIAAGRFDAEVAVVISNISKAVILERARAAGVPAVHVLGKGRTREEFDAEVNSVLEAHGVDIVLLVGFMRILSPVFCNAWKGRAVNVHPSLLPKHAALMDLEVHQSVLDAGDTESGCTVHMVDEVVDAGSIVVQPSVAVDPNDTAESLKAKVQALEAPALVEAVRIFSENGNKFPQVDLGTNDDGSVSPAEEEQEQEQEPQEQQQQQQQQQQQVATEVLALSALHGRLSYQHQQDPWYKTKK